MPNYDPEIDRLGFPELSSTLANTIRNLAKNQPPIILRGCKGEK